MACYLGAIVHLIDTNLEFILPYILRTLPAYHQMFLSQLVDLSPQSSLYRRILLTFLICQERLSKQPWEAGTPEPLTFLFWSFETLTHYSILQIFPTV